MQGVLDTDINILTGSIVIKYDACLINSGAILASLHDRGHIHITDGTSGEATQGIHSVGIHAAGHSAGVHPVQKVAHAFIAKLIETAIERSATAMVMALI
jgi:hypothetical protein